VRGFGRIDAMYCRRFEMQGQAMMSNSREDAKLQLAYGFAHYRPLATRQHR